MPDELHGSALRSLSKPVFSAWQSGLFICGTEDQSAARKSTNSIVLGRLDLDRQEIASRESGGLAIWTHPVHDEVCDKAFEAGVGCIWQGGDCCDRDDTTRRVTRTAP